MAGRIEGIPEKNNMKILFLEPYPIEGPSSRYRVEQYIPYFRNNGMQCIVRPFVSSRFYKILYRKGLYFQKALFFLQSAFKRLFDISLAARSDIIFIHLEAFPFGPPVFEWIFSKFGKKIIYDFDDAIYLGITSPANKFLKYLKCPSKVKKNIALSAHVITCNQYLADYAKKYNKNVTVIHTCLDMEKFSPRQRDGSDKVTIGWIGSHSTAYYLELLKNVFIAIGTMLKFKIKIIGAGDYDFRIPGVDIESLKWSLEDEVEQLRSFDIGVYPLPENQWVLGKAGFKTIQYMSVGVPCVVSNVGINKDIVEDGINGFLAKTEEEWVHKLSRLIDDSQLRQRVGDQGRRTAEQRFSLKANAPIYLDILNKIGLLSAK